MRDVLFANRLDDMFKPSILQPASHRPGSRSVRRTEKRGDVADVTGTPWPESAKGYFFMSQVHFG
ncbi:hypothetical protein HPTD01_3595 [Halomonas sp. TD01]|nr:hypothetical protein GME_12277 [Halomonas sp. TD01]CAH1045117.1 hypothetical protein HPTD01_3595 [Halomonas sp. TD01]